MFGLTTKLFAGHRKPVRKSTFKPQFETLEKREVMSVVTHAGLTTAIGAINYLPPPQPTAAALALINGLANTPVRTTALADYQRDGIITRNDMMDILNKGTNGYTSLTSDEMASLHTLVNNGSTVGMPAYVQDLASKVVFSGTAETYYTEGLLNPTREVFHAAPKGQLGGTFTVVANSAYLADRKAAAQGIQQAVDNYFLGEVYPDDSYVYNGVTYTPSYWLVNLPLFNGTPRYQDVAQGEVGDCWLMASLAEVANRNPGDITSMFIDNGDGTFTVRFYNGSTPDYVTVDRYLPMGGGTYDHPQGDMWAALVEKAYAQENAAGWIGTNHPGVASYQAMNDGYVKWAIAAITGLSAPTSTSMNFNSISSAWSAGAFVVMCTPDNPASSLVVPDHCYAVLNTNAGWITLFNPWGVNSVSKPGLIEANAQGVSQNFTSWVEAGAAAKLNVPVTVSFVAFGPTGANPSPVTQNVPTASAPQTLADVFDHAEWHVDHAMLTSLAARNGGVSTPTLTADATQAFGDLGVSRW